MIYKKNGKILTKDGHLCNTCCISGEPGKCCVQDCVCYSLHFDCRWLNICPGGEVWVHEQFTIVAVSPTGNECYWYGVNTHTVGLCEGDVLVVTRRARIYWAENRILFGDEPADFYIDSALPFFPVHIKRNENESLEDFCARTISGSLVVRDSPLEYLAISWEPNCDCIYPTTTTGTTGTTETTVTTETTETTTTTTTTGTTTTTTTTTREEPTLGCCIGEQQWPYMEVTISGVGLSETCQGCIPFGAQSGMYTFAINESFILEAGGGCQWNWTGTRKVGELNLYNEPVCTGSFTTYDVNINGVNLTVDGEYGGIHAHGNYGSYFIFGGPLFCGQAGKPNQNTGCFVGGTASNNASWG